MNVMIVLQARMMSSRLPGKAMLPVAGFPCALLAALRAGNKGGRVRVAVPQDSSDDSLANFVEDHRLDVFRGPMDDVLARYYLATRELPEDGILVRFTADNVVPDGEMAQQLAAALDHSAAEYCSAPYPESRLPYGAAGEAFKVRALRRAYFLATSSYDREHVGPWMARNCKSIEWKPEKLEGCDYSYLRCTVDDAEDYARIVRLFEGIEDPVRVPWKRLVAKLADLPGEPQFRVPWKRATNGVQSEMTLGTAQLGSNYGIVNQSGQPSKAAAVKMIHEAISHGVTQLDTARAYGDAEAVIGEGMGGAWRSRAEVITKLDPLELLRSDTSLRLIRRAVDESIERSCASLGVQHLSTVLLHRWEHRSWRGGAIWQRLVELRDQGRIGKLGASIYEPHHALEALMDPNIRHLQIPLHVLDYRWREKGVDRAATARPDVTVHARSVLLQGLLASEARYWPEFPAYDAADCMRKLKNLSEHFERENTLDLCIAYVRAQEWVSSLVLGCETLAQLREILLIFRRARLSAEQCEELEQSLPVAPEIVLNPSLWKFNHEQYVSQAG